MHWLLRILTYRRLTATLFIVFLVGLVQWRKWYDRQPWHDGGTTLHLEERDLTSIPAEFDPVGHPDLERMELADVPVYVFHLKGPTREETIRDIEALKDQRIRLLAPGTEIEF